MKQTVIAMFDSTAEAQQSVELLKQNGFSSEQVDISTNTRQQSTDQSIRSESDDDSFGEKVSRFFRNLFDDDSESTRYSSVANNAAVVTVITEEQSEATKASEILDSCGAVDVDERYSEMNSEREQSYDDIKAKRPGTTSVDQTDSRISGQYDENEERISKFEEERDQDTKSIPVIEENLHVGKREVEGGSVRIRSRIIERPVEESVRLREERIYVERNPVNRVASEGDLNSFREGEIELKQRAEVPDVRKEARVVEEINLRRDVSEREETIKDTVRKTEVDIDESQTENSALRKKRNK